MEIIVAVAANTAIGLNNQMPWHLPADLAHFKKITTGNIVLMGRKTYQSIGKLLPNRENWILSRDTSFKVPEAKHFYQWADVVAAEKNTTKTIFLIGGGQLYKYAIDNHLVTKVHLTRILTSPEADTFFPDLDPTEFQLFEEKKYMADEKNTFDYRFETWIKI